VVVLVQVGQVVLEHRPEQQLPPQHIASVVHATPSWLQVGQAVLEHRPEQHALLQHCASVLQVAPVALHVGGNSQVPEVQVVPEQHTPVAHD
jgi:hypothetical protein